MSNYTKDSENIYMLNDKCIVQSLDSDSALNAIPSQQLFKDTYDQLSSVDNSISTAVDTCGLDITELSTYVKNNTVKKTGDTIIGDLSVNGVINVVKAHVDQSNDDAYTHVSADINGVTVNLSGESRKISLNLTHSTNDVIINDTSLSTHIKNDVDSKAADVLVAAKAFTLDEIQKLDVVDSAVEKKFVTSVSETDGIINVSRAELSASDIPELAESKITNLVNDLNDRLLTADFKTSLINNDGKLLSAENFNFTYDSNTHLIWLYAGDNHLSVDANDFIRGRTFKKIEITKVGEQTVMRIWISDPTIPSPVSGTDYIDVNINDLTQVYKSSNTISIDSTLAIHTTSEVALTSQVAIVDNKITNLNCDNRFDSTKTEVVTSLAQSSGKIAYAVKELDQTMVKGLSDYVSQQIQLSVNSLNRDVISEGNKVVYAVSEENGIISAASRHIVKEDFGYVSDTLPGNQLKKSQIENLPSELETLSTDIEELTVAAVKDLKFVKHIYITPDSISDSIVHFFTQQNLFIKDGDKVQNGSIYDISFGGSFELSDKFVITDGSNELTLGNGDWLIVHSHTNNEYVSATELTSSGDSKSVYIVKAGVSRYEFEKECAIRLNNDTRISTETSCKIWIKDPASDKYANGAYGNLSVIKIPAPEYELSVVGGTLCNDVLYIVSADYIDAYGEELCNLYTPGVEGMSNAANTLYVQNEIDLTVKSLSATDAIVEKQFVTAVSETNGIINVSRNIIASSDIPELPESKIANLTNDLTAYQQSLSNYTITKVVDSNAIGDLSAKINEIIDVLNQAFGLKIS